MAVIYITEADQTQHKFRFPAEEGFVATIGRDADCLISLPNVVGISGLHCSISYEGGRFVIKDEGSSNGTYVDGRAVGMEALRPGSVYTIGEATMTFDPEVAPLPDAVPAPAPSPDTEATEPLTDDAAPAPAAGAPKPAKRAMKARRRAEPEPVLANKPLALVLNVAYVVVVLILAVYAGMALRRWVESGKVQAPAPAAAVQPAKEAPAAGAE